MTHDILISGFGGQGVMAIGKTLAEGGMKEGYEVSWLPSYGPEMRGGTANCSVVISDDMIISPIVLEPTLLIAMNTPSLVKFGPNVIPEGKVFVNSSIVDMAVERTDVSAYYVPTMEIAQKLGNPRVANMVMLGAVNHVTGLLREETVREMLSQLFTGPKASLVELNLEALRMGAACAANDACMIWSNTHEYHD